jgi:hypothetical protein
MYTLCVLQAAAKGARSKLRIEPDIRESESRARLFG